MDIMPSSEIAQQLLLFHTQLFEATDEIELIFQVIGRDQFSGRYPSNLDILLRRFNEVQFWTTSEILLAPNASKRVSVLKKFIKIALFAKDNNDHMTLFAVTLGLSNVSVSRLTHLWEKLPSKLNRQYAELEALLDPSRNHRAYRMLVSKMHPPGIPFIPLLLKDLTFIHEGNKTFFGNLVNFEKMHMIANVLRSFRNCKAKFLQAHTVPAKKMSYPQNLIK
jgi:Rap guanine nucleotide exchange factor 4